MDALYKLFVDDEVVLFKTNPVNAYTGTFIERSLAPLIDYGVFSLVHGGSDVGAYLCEHESIDSIHITGSHHSHDAIVWGNTPEEQNQRKERKTPKLTKTITSELGCVTPIFIVPGPWSTSDMQYQARHVASMVAHNASFNCNAAKVLITAKDWPLREPFLNHLKHALAAIPTRQAYYPGAQERYNTFLQHYPHAEALTDSPPGTLPWTFIENVPALKNEYALCNEAFCGILSHINIDTDNAAEFLERSAKFANENIWGSLSCGLLIHPKTMKKHAADVERALETLRYGAIAINTWPGVIFGLGSTTWGAYPGNPSDNIESGQGMVHNTFLFDYPEKSVLKAPSRIKPTPAWFADNKNLAQIGAALTQFEATGSYWKIPSIISAALRG